MNNFKTGLAFFTREWRGSLASRTAALVPLAGLAAGLAATFTSSPEDVPIAAPLFLLQVLLYGLPLFAILVAAGSAHSESGESLLLATLPVSNLARAGGKFSALLCCFAAASTLAIGLPTLYGLPVSSAALLFGYSLGAAALFLAIGLFVGFAIRDGIKAHLFALGAWLVLTLGANLAGYLLLPFSATSIQPALWAALMMFSPLDALRIGVLFSIESVPFDTASIPALARWWLDHPGLWFAALATALTAAALLAAALATRRKAG